MSDYTIVNIREHENIAPRFGMPDGALPEEGARLRDRRRRARTLEPGFRTPFGHKHARQEELYVILVERLAIS